MNTVERSRVGESAVMLHFLKEGYEVYSPIFGNSSNDLIVAKGGQIFRVEVKTTEFMPDGKTYEVQLRSSRHNLSGNKVRKFNADNSDLLAVYIMPEDCVKVFDSTEFHGRSTMRVKV